MALLSQVSTGYPRVPRDCFCLDTGISVFLSGHGRISFFEGSSRTKNLFDHPTTDGTLLTVVTDTLDPKQIARYHQYVDPLPEAYSAY